MAKIRRGIQRVAELVNSEAQRIDSVNLTNIASMEIFQIRPFLTGCEPGKEWGGLGGLVS